ncbi:glycosyltransferase [Algoriphagus sp. SE2]|uniref:glycosyltransferase n=1 Tax=Algoriphagus sp. SE2 TaxID=3141536 RepID=UPI0031CD1F03
MRIIQLITRPQRRGAEIFAVQLAECLKSRGHELWVISLLEGPGGISFSEGLIQMDFKNRPKLDYKGFKELAATIKKIKPDIIQANASDTLRYAVGARLIGAGDFVLIYRNANTLSRFIKSKKQRLFNSLLHRNVDAVISVSENSLMDYRQTFRPKNSISIPIGIDPNEIQKKLEISVEPQKDDYLLFVGSLVSEKDPLGMVTIFKEVLKIYPKIRLKFLGSGSLESSLTEKIETDKLQDSVEIIPNQSNIFPLLSQAKVLVMPSKIEGLPAVILEAMYCKVPVIAYAAGGIPEVLMSKKTGWCIETGNQEAFEASVLEVLNTPPTELEKITDAAKALVLKKYQMDQVGKEFEGFYFELI